MSGGSLEFVYARVHDTAETIAARSQTPLHRAFATHLKNVAKALHDLEWVWSADYAAGDEEAAIRKVITLDDEVKAAIQAAEITRRDLDAVLARLKASQH